MFIYLSASEPLLFECAQYYEIPNVLDVVVKIKFFHNFFFFLFQDYYTYNDSDYLIFLEIHQKEFNLWEY